MSDRDVQWESGVLDVGEMRLLLENLGLDLTYVDERDRIRYYSQGFRIFSRTPDIIGSDVLVCHSEASRPRIARLMSELKSGWRDSAEFLERQDGRDVEVRYVALRDRDGVYRGVLEIARYVDDGSEA